MTLFKENQVSVRILSDNTASGAYESENGLSLLVSLYDFTILFDTGQGENLFSNATKMGLMLDDIDALVLSHGHYDHTGGIPEIIRRNPEVEVFLHPDAVISRYSMNPVHPGKQIGMPEMSVSALKNHHPSKIHLVRSPVEAHGGIMLTGAVPRESKMENTGGAFSLDPQGLSTDAISDDMSMWLTTEKGLLIILGCCHSGIVNTVEYIRRESGTERILGIIGGMHLLNSGCERIDFTCRKLQEWAPEFIVPCHCTGENAVNAISSCMPCNTMKSAVGMVMNV